MQQPRRPSFTLHRAISHLYVCTYIRQAKLHRPSSIPLQVYVVFCPALFVYKSQSQFRDQESAQPPVHPTTRMFRPCCTYVRTYKCMALSLCKVIADGRIS